MKSMFHRAAPSVTAVGLLLLPLGAQVASAQPTPEAQLHAALGDVKFTAATTPQFETAVAALLAKANGDLKTVNAIVGAAVQARPDLQTQTINAAVAAMTASRAGASQEALRSIIRIAAVSEVAGSDSQAKNLLASSLPSGVSLGSASDAQMEEAVKAAVSRDPRMAEGIVRVAIISKVPASERKASGPRTPRRRMAPRGDGKRTADSSTSYNPWGSSLLQSFALIAAVSEVAGSDSQAKNLLASSLPSGVSLGSASDAQMEEAVKAAVSRDPRMAEGIVRVAIISKVPASERKAAPRRQRRAPRGDGKSTADNTTYNPWATVSVGSAQPYVFIAANTTNAEAYINAVIAAAVSAAPDRAAAIVAAATAVAPAYASTISQAATSAAPGQAGAISSASASAATVSVASESEAYVNAIVAAAISAAPGQAVAIARAAATAAPAYAVTITQTAITYAPPALSAEIAQATAAAAPDQAAAIAQVASSTTSGNTTNVVRATGLDAGSASASSAGTINPANISGTGTDEANMDTSPSDQTGN